jgi:hypothetical protein
VVEPAFRVLLVTNPAVAAIVGDRVYHNVRPANERRPSIVLARISTFFARRFGGDFGFTKGRIQVDCLAESYQTAKELAAAAKARLDQYKSRQPVEGVRFIYIEVEDERDLSAAPLQGQASPLFGVSVDTRFLFEE